MHNTTKLPPVSIKKPIFYGRVFSIALGIILISWGTFSRLDSGAVAMGEVIPFGSALTVQHLDGGVIDAIFIKEGDNVIKGQPLLQLNPIDTDASFQMMIKERETIKTEIERLESEINGQAVKSLTNQLAASYKTQLDLTHSRLAASTQDSAILSQQIAQSEREITALRSQRLAAEVILRNSEDQLRSDQDLYDQQYIEKSKYLESQSKASQSKGELGRIEAEISRAQQKIIETHFQIERSRSNWKNDSLEQLQKSQDDLASVEEKIRVVSDRKKRLIVYAPQDGKVKGFVFNTIGGVIKAGDTLMQIIPKNDRLVVQARLMPDDIEAIRIGLKAYIRISAYKSREHNAISGHVLSVSGDTFKDEHTGSAYYKVDIDLNRKDLEKIKLYPGMLAQVEIITGSRTVLHYLVDPILESFHRSFKED